MNLTRLLKHLLVPDWVARRAFPAASLSRIGRAIRASEQKHDGELRFVIEGALPVRYLLGKKSSRTRAEDLFATLKIWDTENNSGMLIYVQLVSRHIDIVADRGISRHIGQAEWDTVCKAMEKAFRAGRYEEGALEAIERCTALLARHFPSSGEQRNELPDRPVFL
jgi:uncharacterized membrane protein